MCSNFHPNNIASVFCTRTIRVDYYDAYFANIKLMAIRYKFHDDSLYPTLRIEN